jgi:photosystem II stability/assembly factor-like uncharacterized protein
MRPFSYCILALCVLGPSARAAEFRAFEDATLRAVHFVDDNVGWAVGDDGVVWNTLDAGKHWDRQPTGVNASLRSVQFIDHNTGWAAGRQELPDGGSAGVVLYTNDGGIKWRQILVNSLPGVHLVRFVDAKLGYLAGEGSDQFPSGVFATLDGGRSWQPVAGPRTSAWRGGDFDAEGGALAGAWNRLATVRRGQVYSIAMDTLGGRNLCGLQLRGEDAFAVGQGGLVLVSNKKRGSSWDLAKLGLPAEVRDQWDFHAVGGVGRDVWAVGRPGSAALHSGDAGKTWEVVRTGQTMPLHGVHFRSAAGGYAVGALGTIIATRDGGKTWQVQRRGGQRLAVLCVHARPRGARLETIAQVGAEDGYLAGGLCVTGPDSASAALGRVGEGCRFSSAFRQAGGTCAETLWQFPVASHLDRADRAATLGAWDRLHGRGAAARQLLAQLVLAIRMYRPDVVVTDHPDASRTNQGVDSLVAEAVKEAFAQAGKADFAPTQLATFGLEVHAPRKLYVAWHESQGAEVALDLTGVIPRLGMSAREFSASPRGVLGQGPAPASRWYHLVSDNLPGARSHRALMQGLNLAPGGFARRDLPAIEPLSAEEMKLVRQRANLWTLSEAAPSALSSPERMLAQVGPALEAMPATAAARVAHGLARQHVRRGQWTLAREMYLLLVQRYPTDPLAIDGYRWLLLHQASSEARRRHEMGQFLIVGQTTHGILGPNRKVNDASPLLAKAPNKPREFPTFETKTITNPAYEGAALDKPEDTRRWFEGAVAMEKKLAAFGPLHVRDPAIQFSVQASKRQLGDFKGALEWYADFATNQPEGPWRTAALSELWLAKREGPSPRPVLTLRSAEKRPYLDGKLDDDCWKDTKPTRLQNAVGSTLKEYPTEMRMTHDKDFVYLAVRCGHPVGKGTPPASKRDRDQDLRQHDRISFMLDLDRDYSTCFHFQIDARGCVAEDCWGDRTWDPRWFVAIHREETAWTAEIAIPRVALTSDHFIPGTTWAANVVRVLPGRGVQAFSLPADAPEQAMRPEGMGLLMFAQPQEATATRKGGAAAR